MRWLTRMRFSKGHSKMDKEAAAENAKKVGGILLVISKYTIGVVWFIIKWAGKIIWWILKNFKVQTGSVVK